MISVPEPLCIGEHSLSAILETLTTPPGDFGKRTRLPTGTLTIDAWDHRSPVIVPTPITFVDMITKTLRVGAHHNSGTAQGIRMVP
jgi:hypothetical protein